MNLIDSHTLGTDLGCGGVLYSGSLKPESMTSSIPVVAVTGDHNNWICVAYPKFFICYHFQENTGWGARYQSPIIDFNLSNVGSTSPATRIGDKSPENRRQGTIIASALSSTTSPISIPANTSPSRSNHNSNQNNNNSNNNNTESSISAQKSPQTTRELFPPDNTGTIITSNTPRLDESRTTGKIEKIAINNRIGDPNDKMIAVTSGSLVKLWVCTDRGEIGAMMY